MTRKEWEALGKLLLPLNMGGSRHLGPKMAEKLLSLGYVQPSEDRIYGNGDSPIDRIPVIVKGYEMTFAGNAAYCAWADTQPVADDAP